MSLSTSIASSRGGGPRKQYTASITAPSPKLHSASASTRSGSRKQQSSNSEEEIAQRQHKNRQSTAKTPCCLISSLCCSFPVWASTLLISASVCFFLFQDMAAT